MRVPEEPVCIDIFRQNPVFTSLHLKSPVHEIIDPVFAKTSQNARFLLSENERLGLVF
jgi:hypothetical protein